mmetsp:Transcript_5589/g.7852  ORF Transcript_5589/g.7852 Transcript_5589/m.7852 type:complete len:92 (-) Transcript_5589:22-297(-)
MRSAGCHCTVLDFCVLVVISCVSQELLARGRHDPCVLPRAVPMVESMVALVLADHLMQQIAQCSLLPEDEEAAINPLGPKPQQDSIVSRQK